MSSMLEELAGALGGDTLGQLAGVLGADNDVVSKGVAAALPALLGGLARNARQPEGASALTNALGNDHDGSILDSLGSIFGGNQWAQQQANRHGESILGHLFGQSRPRVEQQVSASSGLSSAMVSKLLPLLAPVVLGYLGKKMRGGDSNQIASTLEQERVAVQQNDGMFGQILDMLDGDDDNDGGLMDMAGDLLKGQAGKMLLGKLLGG
jgi:hypothetical protein